jgi:hypothetical protein
MISVQAGGGFDPEWVHNRSIKRVRCRRRRGRTAGAPSELVNEMEMDNVSGIQPVKLSDD